MSAPPPIHISTLLDQYVGNSVAHHGKGPARWGVVEWIKYPLLMLCGSNPTPSIKIPLLYPDAKRLFGARHTFKFGYTRGSRLG